MKNLINSLYASTGSMMPIFFAPPDELGGIPSFGNDAGGGGGGGVQDQLPAGQQTPLIGVNDEEDGNSGLDDDVFKMFTPEEDPNADDDDPQNLNHDVPEAQITAMQTEVQTAIRNMRLPDNIIPADFDPNDRSQLMSVLTNVQQATIAQSLNVVFKPVQLALKHMNQQMNAVIDSKVNATKKGITEQSIFEQIVPEIGNPKYAGMIKGMDAQLQANGKGVKERAQTIRKLLNQMNIKDDTPPSNGNHRRASNPNGGGGQQGMKTGKSALDSFFGPMPVLK